MLSRVIPIAVAAAILVIAGCPTGDVVNGLIAIGSANIIGQQGDQIPGGGGGGDGLEPDGSANANEAGPDQAPEDGSGLEPNGSENINSNGAADIPDEPANENENSADDDVPAGTTRLMIFLHGRPTDGFSAINVSVTDVEFIGDSETAYPLAIAARANLLSESTSAFLVCVDDAPVGEFSKLRLTIRSPEFVRADGSVVPASRTRVLANGKLDLNARDALIEVREAMTNVVELDIADDANAVHVNETGNGMVSLRSQVMVTPRNALSAPLEITAAIVLSTDAGDGPGDTEENLIEVSDGQCGKRVALRPGTAVEDSVRPRSIVDLVPDTPVRIIGEYEADRGVVVAERIVILR
ncbi:MAG: hypothetical protein IT450_10650 [Phycisphaerales bacterium]|nr:hypothetical protein [Phycisphaerales bacterium]